MQKKNPDAKHIVLVIRLLNGRSGGAERIYCELANILEDEGHRVTCLHFDSKPGEPFYKMSSRVERINIYGPPSSWTRRREFFYRFLWSSLQDQADWDRKNTFFIKQLKDYFELVKPDIAISILPPANTPTLLAAAGTSVRVVACNHNVPEQDYDNPLRWGASRKDRRERLRALNYAAAIHVLFPGFGEWFPSHLKDRIVAIPNYISPAIRMPSTSPKQENTILAVGRLADVKNYRQLLTSWATVVAEFPDWKVKIFGIGPQQEELENDIVTLNLQHTVELSGHVHDLSEEYAKASIFCHPALFEGFGLSVAEALYLKTPVVCYSDCSGVKEFVRDGYNGLTVQRSGDKDGLADALRRLMTDKNLRDELAANGPESVSGFTLDAYVARWKRLISQLETVNL